ncbi:uncharacterized protein LOC141607657 [Silene latifolia]|uniref:uncharacterized protein LOC141607657 n=1 Tax=Silene latifolia TaxID=37657 RepID=UPI003D7838B4
MAPFEALYGRKCRSLICWDDSTEAVLLGPQMIQDMIDQVCAIREKMRAAQDREKTYADLRRSDLEFAVGDKIVGEVAYRLALLPALDRVHNVFHVSQLSKYISDLSHVLEAKMIELDDALTCVETPKEILYRKVRKTRHGETILVKVLWSNHLVEEAIWEAEENMKERYPHLFEQCPTRSSALMPIHRVYTAIWLSELRFNTIPPLC